MTWASPGAAQTLGAAATDIVGHTASRFFTPEDVAIGIPQQEIAVARSAGSGNDDRWMTRADGSRFWASGLMVALRDADGEVICFVKILRDLTDLKMQMETLRNRGDALEAADDAKGRSIAMLAHELRNPLGSVGMAANVLRQLSGEAPRLQAPLDIIERNVGFAARLIDDVEDASRVGAGKLGIQPETLVLYEALQASQQAALGRAGEARDIDLLLPAVPITMEGDRLRLQQVFVNLIGNAIKFTPPGGRIWITATVEGRQAVVRVEDEGIGIAPDMLERIFGMFTQISTSTAAAAGMGIGLALVKEIVELHGGSVQARSAGIGKGSEFTVRLPLQQPGSDARSPGEAAIGPDRTGSGGGTDAP